MGKENFIKGKVDDCHHVGRRSNVRALDSILDRFRDHLTGEEVDSSTQRPTEAFLNPIDLIPEDQEIILFFYEKPPEG